MQTCSDQVLDTKEFVDRKLFEVIKIKKLDQLADILTKALRTEIFDRMIPRIMT